MVSNCTVPGGVGSITASGKKLQERMLAVCQQCLLWFFENELLYSSHGKSFLARIVRTVFRTRRQERWLDCTCLKKKLLFQLSWKSRVAATSKWPLGRPFLGKNHFGHWVKLACSGVAGTISKTKLRSGGHGFKLHRSRRCWLNHCIRQKAARKNVDGLPAMPRLVL